MQYTKLSVEGTGDTTETKSTHVFLLVLSTEMVGIKNRGSQMHKVKTKYDRKYKNKYEYCIPCKICLKPFEPESKEDVCPECGGKNGA